VKKQISRKMMICDMEVTNEQDGIDTNTWIDPIPMNTSFQEYELSYAKAGPEQSGATMTTLQANEQETILSTTPASRAMIDALFSTTPTLLDHDQFAANTTTTSTTPTSALNLFESNLITHGFFENHVSGSNNNSGSGSFGETASIEQVDSTRTEFDSTTTANTTTSSANAATTATTTTADLTNLFDFSEVSYAIESSLGQHTQRNIQPTDTIFVQDPQLSEMMMMNIWDQIPGFSLRGTYIVGRVYQITSGCELEVISYNTFRNGDILCPKNLCRYTIKIANYECATIDPQNNAPTSHVNSQQQLSEQYLLLPRLARFELLCELTNARMSVNLHYEMFRNANNIKAWLVSNPTYVIVYCQDFDAKTGHICGDVYPCPSQKVVQLSKPVTDNLDAHGYGTYFDSSEKCKEFQSYHPLTQNIHHYRRFIERSKTSGLYISNSGKSYIVVPLNNKPL
jgi:hypothetical protein